MENLQPKPARRSAAKTIWAPTALTLPKSSDGSSTASVSTQTVATSAKLQERPARIAATACNALFVLLVVVNVIRTLHHAMWRDELQSFMLALYSSSPWDLLQKLKYEGHPGLWHALLWMVTRVTSDPVWMQVLHIGLAIGVWVIIYRWSPFSKIEKFLLLLSYFLFWEYFIISRNYVLIALTAFAFLALRDRQPRPDFLLWLLLGLLANTHIFGTIWSIALAVTLSIEAVRRRSVRIAGPVVYVILLVLAIATVMRPEIKPRTEFGLGTENVSSNFSRVADLTLPIGAFVPLQLNSIREAIAFITDPKAASIPKFWNSNSTEDLVALTHADTDHPVRLALLFAAPIIICWLITRDPLRVLEFALVYLGIVLFVTLFWAVPLAARIRGIIFLALIGSAWSARSRHSPTISSFCLLAALLIVNACGGVLTLASELRPFSDGYNVAAWIKGNNLADTFLIGSRDAQTSTVAGYLRRPIYYLECECEGTFIAWNRNRQSLLAPQEFRDRLTRAVALAPQHNATLICFQPIIIDDLTSSEPNLDITLLKSFTDAQSTSENFWIYRVRQKQPL